MTFENRQNTKRSESVTMKAPVAIHEAAGDAVSYICGVGAFLPPELLFQLLKRLGAHFFTPFLQAERTPCDSNGDFLHA